MVTRTQKIVITALLSALVCVLTMVIRIPSPLGGYINIGDGIVIACGWIISPICAFLGAAIGSALADLLWGYFIYAPITFIIKGTMSIIACFVVKSFKNKISLTFSRILSALLAELVMILGYYAFEGALYGFIPALTNLPANLIQGAFGIIFSLLLVKVFDKSKIF